MRGAPCCAMKPPIRHASSAARAAACRGGRGSLAARRERRSSMTPRTKRASTAALKRAWEGRSTSPPARAMAGPCWWRAGQAAIRVTSICMTRWARAPGT
ncbi:hypothetical protein G6F68_018341 [Rhizopus microsporus]|nr:hypothetical protein G6F68_018341 [Rhizopus microsporus]